MISNYRLIVALLFLSFASVFTAKADVIDDITALMKSGNAKEIVQFLAPTVELAILSDEDEYPKSQVESVLRSFFTKHTPQAVKIIHKITSNPNYRFAVINLTTSSGNFRTSVSLKSISGKFLITEMRIEQE